MKSCIAKFYEGQSYYYSKDKEWICTESPLNIEHLLKYFPETIAVKLAYKLRAKEGYSYFAIPHNWLR